MKPVTKAFGFGRVVLGHVGASRHLAVGTATALVGLATITGTIGEDTSQRFDAKQIVVSPVGDDGLRVAETVDQDFGGHHKHGYERIVPTDFGAVTDIEASSPNAPDDLDVTDLGLNTRIRIGDPDTTIKGRHRYQLAYTYPDTGIADGKLALDIIGNEERFKTTRFEVIVTGLELEDPTCNVGSSGDVGGCELVDDGEVYRVVFEPLDAGDGITIGATVVGSRDIVEIDAPPLPPAKPNRRVRLTAAAIATGALTGGGAYLIARRRGRNEVFGGGAADAAFGFDPPQPGEVAQATGATRTVSDAKLGEFATTEFAPPSGVEPWLGRVLLTERIDHQLVTSWISARTANDVLTVTTNDSGKVVLSKGPRFDAAPGPERSILNKLLNGNDSIELGDYRKGFAAACIEIAAEQRKFVAESGLWKRPLPGGGLGSRPEGIGIIAVSACAGMLGLFLAGISQAPVFGWVGTPILLSVLFTGIVALIAYRRLLPARTAIGSSFAIRTESFRRFLAASEAQHVEWAWERGVLRDYSAWAVALGTAATWERALQDSNVPSAENYVGPMVFYHSPSAVMSTSVKPSTSGGGGGGGGGFSGGSVGGGGGGGSSGSW